MRAGHIPTDRIAPILELAIRQRWPQGHGLDVLAEKAGCDVSTLEGILGGERAQTEFDLADRLLCGVGAQGAWWGELSDVYYDIEFRETCALPGCGKVFPERGHGKRIKRYCSRRCQDLGRQIRVGRKTTGQRFRQRGRCLKGHRIPESQRQCLICRREQQRIRKQSDPIYAERVRKAQREWAKAKRARVAA